jgi:hypothetical protein
MCRFHRRDRTSCRFARIVAIWRVGTASPSRRDRQFESPFLQRGVTCEPEFSQDRSSRPISRGRWPTGSARLPWPCLDARRHWPRAGFEQRSRSRHRSAPTLQIPPSPLRPHFVRAMVRVHEYPDGRLAIFHGPHRLADYDPEGKPRDDAKLAA